MKMGNKKVKDLTVNEIISLFKNKFNIVERQWNDITENCVISQRLTGASNSCYHYGLQVEYGEDLLFVWNFNTKKMKPFCTLENKDRYKFEIQKDGDFRILYLATKGELESEY